jgi:hypothetical protein
VKALSTIGVVEKNRIARRALNLVLAVACLAIFSARADASQLPYNGWCAPYSVGYYPYYGFAYSTAYYPYAYSTAYYPYATYYAPAASGYYAYGQPYVAAYAAPAPVSAPYGYYVYPGWGGASYAYPDWTSGWGWRYGPGWGF